MPLSLGFAKGTASLNKNKLWSPLQLSPAVWLDATDTNTVVLTSGAVSQWSDKSGNNRHATQSTAASRPTLQNKYNLLTYTEQFELATWDKYGISVSANATTDPRGTTTADLITESANLATHGINYTSSGVPVVSGSAYIYSFYIKPNGRTVVNVYGDAQAGYLNTSSVKVDLSNGTVVSLGSATSATVTPSGNGWYRMEVTATATGSTASPGVYLTDGTNQTYTGNGSSGVYIWGAQLVLANMFPQNTYQSVAASGSHDPSSLFPGYILFDGVDDSLNVANWGNVTQPFTRVVVFNPVVMGGALNKFILESLSPTALTDIGELLVAGQNAITSGENPYTPCFRNNSYIRVSANNLTSSVAHTNGVASVTYTRAANQYQTGYAIGWDGVGYNSWANVRIWEVLLIPRVLSDLERQRLEGYLAGKYGLKTKLPANHPFKTSMPEVEFSPTSISNLALWLDSSDASTLYQSSGGSLAAADGDVVGEWRDKSGNGRHFTQAAAASKPVLKLAAMNQKSTVRGDGSNDRLQQLSVSPNYTVRSNFTLFIVLNQRSGSGNSINRAIGNADGGIGSNCLALLASSSTSGQNYFALRNASNSGAADISMTGTVSQLTNQVYTLRVSSSGVYAWRAGEGTTFAGGNANITDLGNPTIPLTLFQDGTPNGTLCCNADISEVIVYDSALSNAQQQTVETYLKKKWGVV